MTLANIQRDDFDGQGKLARDHGPVDLAGVVVELAEKQAAWNKDAADGAAGTATAEHAVFRNRTHALKVLGVTYIPDAALTGHDTNFATIIVRRRTALGADGGIVATQTTKLTGGSGTWVAFVPVAIPLAAPVNVDLAAGQSLTVEIAKAAAGVAVPAGSLLIALS